MLPLPNHDFTGAVGKMASYAAAAALGKRLLLELPLPARGARVGDCWVEDLAGGRLLPSPGHLYFTEHSERHWLPSVTGALGVTKDKRDMLGRWAVDSSHQSND